MGVHAHSIRPGSAASQEATAKRPLVGCGAREGANMIERMPTVAVSTFRRKTRAYLKLAEDHPILITRYGKPAFVLMSVNHYEHITSLDTK
ncbi:type II toxin-antitoxin system prevent-host-death family antitoxin [Pelagimonas phthalicica]